MRSNRDDGRAVITGWPDAAVGWTAAGQRTLVTHAQLRDFGVSNSAIARAVARGRLYRVHRGVYSVVAGSVRPPFAAELAAVLAYGEGAVVSHSSALAVHGIRLAGVAPEPRVHVTLAGRATRTSHAGTVVHRTGVLHRDDRLHLNGLPVASVARIVIDLSPTLAVRQRELLIDQALGSRRTSRTKLSEALDRHPGRPGTPAIRALLDPSRPSSVTWSPPEEELRELITQAGLPNPESNVALTREYTPDLLWREQRVIVEYDSEKWHLGRRAFHADRTRHNELTATEGYQVLHVTDEHTPMQVLVWIVRALARSAN
jgi:hypothetical protein